MCCAGVGQTTALSQPRCAGPQVARPVYRISCRSRKAVRRHLAVLSSWSVFPRAAQGTNRCVVDRWDIDRREVPCAPQRANWLASRRAVVTRSPVFCGSKEGATTPQPWPFVVRERESPQPQGPASETKTRAGSWTAVADARVDITLPGPDRPQRDDFCAIFLGDLGDRDGLCMDIHPSVECARLRHGCPPSVLG